MHTIKAALKKVLRKPYYRLKYRRAKHRNKEKLKMTDNIRWGILATGAISRSFAHALSLIPDATLVAVGSRSQASADKFGEEFAAPNSYSSYEGVANDPDVDVVYIGTPHTLHMENTLMCLEAGKPVLVEKPFALNASQARRMIEAAREKGLFLMEAMWTRFLPAIRHLRKTLDAKQLGDVQVFQADFGFRAPYDPAGRLFNRELGGGALLDVGIYPVSFASMVFGEQPEHIQSDAFLGETGVDERFGAIFRYPGGEMATLSGTLRSNTPREAIISGSRGNMVIHRPFWQAEKTTTILENEAEKVIEHKIEGNGLKYQAIAVMENLRAGKLESEVMPLDETLAIMQTMDTIREPWGLQYPGE
jgi:predicted dehydrogenase